MRLARHGESKALGGLLGKAFFDDPIWMWVVQDPERRRKHLGQFLAQVIHGRVKAGTVWTTTEQEGTAVWAPPGEWKVHPLAMLPALPSALRCVGFRELQTRLEAFAKMEAGHLRGLGVGTALITPMVDRCDEEGLPAYLESSKRGNLPFYHRFGFEVTEELTIASGCDPIWRMWRDPR